MKISLQFTRILLIISCLFCITFSQWEKIGLDGINVTAIDASTFTAVPQILIGTKGKGIYRYNFDRITPFYTGWLDTFELFMKNIHSVRFYSGKGVASNYFAGTDSGLCHYFSMDNDDSSFWGIITKTPINYVNGIISLNDTMFIVTPLETYRRNMAGGYLEPWHALNPVSFLPQGQKNPFFTSLALNEYTKKELFLASRCDSVAGAWSGVLVTKDGGHSWKILNNGFPQNLWSVNSLAFFQKIFNDTNGGMLCGTNQGIFFYNNQANAWERFKQGIVDNRIVNHLYISHFSWSFIAEVFASTDSGAYLLSGYPNNSIDQAQWCKISPDMKINCSYQIPNGSSGKDFWLVGTDNGLYKYTRPPIALKPLLYCNSRQKYNVKIYQNNKAITIYADLKGSTDAYYSLYNSKGQIIVNRVSFNTTMVKIKSNSFVKGIYIIGIQIGEYSFRHTITITR